MKCGFLRGKCPRLAGCVYIEYQSTNQEFNAQTATSPATATARSAASRAACQTRKTQCNARYSYERCVMRASAHNPRCAPKPCGNMPHCNVMRLRRDCSAIAGCCNTRTEYRF